MQEQRATTDKLLVQIAEMMQTIQKNKGSFSNRLTPEILGKIERLELIFAALQEIDQRILDTVGVDMQRLGIETLHSTEISSQDKQLLQRAQALENDARQLQTAVSNAIGKRKDAKRKGSSTKKKIKERRKLFKPLGENKNWIPL